MKLDTDKLVDGPTLLNTLFADDCRPSLSTLARWKKRRAIPIIKIGHKVFFDVAKVRAKLAEKNEIRAL